ncbi:MAG: DUF3048 domain-containing protein [Dehalococcoidia bacterium]|nr:DUF3048 domain-containing protein [Dehalococcoidia bacterium]
MQPLLQFLRRYRIAVGAAAGAVLALGVAIAAIALLGGGGTTSAAPEFTPAADPTSTATATRTATVSVTPSATPVRYYGILDGVEMSAAEWAERKDLLPLAIMMDNTPNSYPHSGLAQADLVYEAFVEGGITRLMAVFWRREADLVMPVRSARTPFVIWVTELGAMYGHAGSANTVNDANAAGQIVEWGVKDLNAFSPEANTGYYRDLGRYAPYNLATGTKKLRDIAATLSFVGPSALETWKFRDSGDPPIAGTKAEGIEVDFQGSRYSWQLIQWKWDAEAKAYGRYQFGGPQIDAVSDKQLKFNTVIVLLAPGRVVDESAHVLLDQLGEGPATVFTGGKAIAGTWKKAERESRTRFYDESGQEIAFERGPIFIEVIGHQSKLTVKATAGELPDLPKYEPPPPGTGPVAPDDTAPDEPEPTATVTASPTPSPTASPTASSTGATGSPSPGPSASATASPDGTTPSPESSATRTESPATTTAEPEASATPEPPSATASP